MCYLNNYLRTKFELDIWEQHFKTETKWVWSSSIFTQISGKDHNDDNGDNDHDDNDYSDVDDDDGDVDVDDDDEVFNLPTVAARFI